MLIIFWRIYSRNGYTPGQIEQVVVEGTNYVEPRLKGPDHIAGCMRFRQMPNLTPGFIRDYQ